MPGRSFTRPPRISTIECSCRLCPTPGMYVVTSIPFVSRTRATLRSAEFGFLGVCVYTRMHTPRFSGQPINAGDLVLTRTASRPMRTSCENVGTVPSFFPRASRAPLSRRVKTRSCLRAQFHERLSPGAHTIARERTHHAERSTANPELQPARTPHALQEAEPRSWLTFGEAYSALRDWRPIPAALPSHSVLQCSGTEDFPSNRTAAADKTATAPNSTGRTTPNKQVSIRKTTCSVKSLLSEPRGNLCGKRGCACRRPQV